MARKANEHRPSDRRGPRRGGRAAVQPVARRMSAGEASSRDRDATRANAGIGNRYAVLAGCVLLLLAVVLVFGQTVGFGFVAFDDEQYVSDNPHVVQGLTASGIAWAFTHSHSANWHPLTWISHMLDCQLYGLRAGGHHLSSILLHAASAILLFLVLRQMTSRLWPCLLVAALFAVHPLRAESVAWVAERKDVLGGLFFMLTLAAYVGYVGRPFSLARYLAVAALFALGLLCKPMLVTLPFVLLLLDWWPLHRFERSAGMYGGEETPIASGVRATGGATGFASVLAVFGGSTGRASGTRSAINTGLNNRNSQFRAALWLVVEKLPLFLLAGASCVVTLLVQREYMATVEYLPVGSRFANALVSCVLYLGKMLYPVGLAAFYPRPQNGWPAWQVVGAALLLLGISLLAIGSWRKRPYLLVGWLWNLGMLVPVIGLVQVGSQAMADRYTYLPQIGLYILLAWTVADVASAWQGGRLVCGAVAAAVVAALMGCAWRQTSYWRNDELLWEHALRYTSNNAFAQNNLGLALGRRGKLDDAVAHIRAALAIDPGYAKAHTNLGVALGQQGKVGEAIAHLRTALQLNPRDAVINCNLGMLLEQQGQAEEAGSCFQKALEVRPNYADAHAGLGLTLLRRGRTDEAVTHFRTALDLNPYCADAHNNLGAVLYQRGALDEAIEHFRKAVEIHPDYASARNNLEIALKQRQQSQPRLP